MRGERVGTSIDDVKPTDRIDSAELRLVQRLKAGDEVTWSGH
jgi:hypothetical protein